MAGLIQSAMTKDWNPSLREVDAQNETTSGQLDKILKSDSPLMTTARTGAAQGANSRGLLNSSMALQAGEQAAINTALPIASADASTYTTKSRDNQSALNQAGQFNAGEANTAAKFNASEQNAATKMNLGAELETELIGSRTAASSQLQGEQARQQQELQAQRATQEGTLQTQRAESERQMQTLRGGQEQALQTLRGAQAENLARIETANRTLLQSSQQAASLYSDIQKQIAAVQADLNLSVEQKQAMVDSLTQQLETGLALHGGMANVDIRGLLNFGGGQASPVAAQANTAPGAYLTDSRVSAESNALKSAMQAAGITTLSQEALGNPAVAQAYNALNAKVNAIHPGNSFSLMADFRL